MNQANKRDKLKRKDPVISEAVRNTAPQEEGWYQVVKLKSCSPYLVKLDLPLEPSDEEYDFAIWTAKWGEHQRLLVNKLKDVGWNKVTTDGNELNEDGLKILGESRDRVFEAFDKGMVIHLNQEFIKKYA